ncbi:TonB-linked SusC/RagA family outer membrane protein [Mucilaginibacter lappiensis]|uniref:TonB-linked SusC/RagA family outer membrane protein n=1 Tax=Mucilaginibacter lappiensis TaxID=354630 RepID=A0ABR6PRY2_9SPHI|nr:TonB-dependent receptor [Mucilaginibacter lappiensis]MBB6112538.1 TonB-linked SusC/RagA family outer membrane protein [Mucilaginibacter lappiensis]
MKLVLILLITTIIQVNAASYAQTVSLNLKNASLREVIEELRQQTGYHFLYKMQMLDETRKISLSVINEPLVQVLEKCFTDQPVTYTVNHNTVILRKRITDNSSQAQAVKITGTVTDEKGLPLPGVSVKVKGTNTGIITDGNGKYAITVNDNKAVLEFTFLGFTKQEVNINGRAEINVKLLEAQTALNEVVVIGYGTVKRSDLTGAVASVKGSDIKAQGVSDVTKALQGKMPGVTIEAAGGDPGSGTRILIRGVGTLGNSAPLYIVDGVQVASINNLNQTDIESIDVLKDASAAAIYGSRAANGVVLVTTKSGKNGAPVVQFTSNVGQQKIAHKIDVLNAQEWATVSNMAHDNAGLPRLDIAKNPDQLGAGTNWQDAIYRNALVQQYNMLVSGGSESTKYSVSGGYNDQQGIVDVTGYKRYNMRVKTETTKGRLKFGETVLLSREKFITMPGGWGGQGGNPVGSAAKMIPVFQIYDPTAVGGFAGAYGPVVNVANPVAQLNLENINREYTSILANAYAQVNLLPGLNYKMNLGYTNGFNSNYDYAKRYSVGTLFSHPTNDINLSKDQNVLTLLENTLNYDKHFGKHSIQALAGYTYQSTKYNYTAAGRTDLPDGIDQIDAGAGISTSGGNSTVSNLVSVLGRVIYSYDNRYLLTASFRRDGSSRFGDANRYGDFPSVALGWNISNEKFFQSLTNTFSTLKLRASYGVLGNQEIGDYQYSAAVASNINYVVGTDQQKWFGSIQTAFASPYIKWESTKTSNVGMDVGFFHDKLNITVDYFNKKTSDLLLNVPIPGSAGSTSNPVVNAGALRNNGIEFGANFNDHIGKLNYSVFGTISAVRNKVLALGTGSQQIFGGQPTHHGASSTLTEAGGSIGSFFLIKDIGIFKSQAEINSYVNKDGKLIQPNAAPGDVKFQDTNGDGQINDNDKVNAGSPFPNFEYGFGVNASMYGFDINLFFQGTQGNKIYNGLRQDLESTNLDFNYSKSMLNAWTPQNQSNIPRAVTSDPNFNNRTSTRFLEDGSYLRMKTLQIGYTLNSALVKKMRITSLRVYASADNLFTITKYTGFNPDLGRTGSIFDRGVDFGHVAYPLARTISLGVQLTL